MTSDLRPHEDDQLSAQQHRRAYDAEFVDSLVRRFEDCLFYEEVKTRPKRFSGIGKTTLLDNAVNAGKYWQIQ